jgi:hypothetical protein
MEIIASNIHRQGRKIEIRLKRASVAPAASDGMRVMMDGSDRMA